MNEDRPEETLGDQGSSADGQEPPSAQPGAQEANLIETTDSASKELIGLRGGELQPDETIVVETSASSPRESESPFRHNPAMGEGARRKPPPKRSGEKTVDQENPKAAAVGKGESGDRKNPAKPAGWITMLVTAALAMVGAAIGAGLILYFSKSDGSDKKSSGASDDARQASHGDSKSKSASASAPGAGSGSEEKTQESQHIPGLSDARGSDALEKQIAHVNERVDGLVRRLDEVAIPKYETPPDLRTLQIKVGELSGVMQDLGGLPSRFRHLSNRLDGLKEEIKGLREHLEANEHRDDPPAPGDTAHGISPAAIVLTPPPTIEGRPDASLAQGIALFQNGKYAEALNVFRMLQVTNANDARVWYYSALSWALSKSDWEGAAVDQVKRGLARERAGTPSKDEIDAAFMNLSEAQGGKWLGAYRKQMIGP